MKNERGIVLPIVLLFVTAMSVMVFIQADYYLKEKRFIEEQEDLIVLNSLLQLALHDYLFLAEKNLENTVFQYEQGSVTLKSEILSEVSYRLSFTAELINGKKRFAFAVYNEEWNYLEEYWEVK
ncbi:competence type IV pilus minor pilin ComGG [Alkalihalobacillus trypoxylicola]|uniref:Competence protein ComG n=1 Tax=Alkalihalobacillus trypoxylicola TaxID=519424 RepID=A0A162DVR1_9BACI|nr:competence type IV pilus minor pilin ComGG [Alkalihalobacillus trypoxylicola]KYG30985.1 hypothetical protein AZF04_18485 [Alkalihalobacillus trypoxylicola]